MRCRLQAARSFQMTQELLPQMTQELLPFKMTARSFQMTQELLLSNDTRAAPSLEMVQDMNLLAPSTSFPSSPRLKRFPGPSSLNARQAFTRFKNDSLALHY